MVDSEASQMSITPHCISGALSTCTAGAVERRRHRDESRVCKPGQHQQHWRNLTMRGSRHVCHVCAESFHGFIVSERQACCTCKESSLRCLCLKCRGIRRVVDSETWQQSFRRAPLPPRKNTEEDLTSNNPGTSSSSGQAATQNTKRI